jgi:undecaprenyl diphosphate synthase
VAVSPALDLYRVPGHVAIVIDDGSHAAGDAALLDVVEGGLEIGLRWLTIDALPAHLWGRPLGEVESLLGRYERLLLDRRDDLHTRGVRLRCIGRRDARLPRRLVRVIEEAETLTAANHGLILTLAVDYDGRAEIADAMAAMTAAVRAGTLLPGVIDEDEVVAHLYAPDLPDPDLLVHTGGDCRTASFLVWQSAYSEFVFTDTRWADFRRADLFDAVAEFQRRERRFGAIDPT